MTFRTPNDMKDEFGAHPQRALIITTVLHESLAVKAHLTDPELLAGPKGEFYEFGRFADPAGDWLIVHARTPQGNSDAGLVARGAHQDFGGFDVQLFVGVAGSLKDDIHIGTIVIGDYVHNAHSAKVEDAETLARPHGLPAALGLLNAAEALIYTDTWRDLIRPPFGMELPKTSAYPCKYPPAAVIKGIASGEEVVAGGKSARYVWLRSRFNDCGAVEMEGWGAMNAARYENTPAIVVRGISDMCAGKDYEKDELYQPIAAAHAAAFAFGLLSFRSQVPAAQGPASAESAPPATESPSMAEKRVEIVFNFDGSKDDWSEEKIQGVVKQLKETVGDETLTLVRVEKGSVRLVISVRESDLEALDLAKLRDATADSGVRLLGAVPANAVSAADSARQSLATASADLLAWETTLPNGQWMERPEREVIEARFQSDSSATVVLGEPGSGKSALLARIAADLLERGATVFALKADYLSPDVRVEADLQNDLGLPGPAADLILRLASLQPVYVIIDQLDALASQLDLKSGRLNVLLNLVRRVGAMPNVHLLLSARTFEFNHDVRLRAIEAEPINLSLPPWHEVKEQLAAVGVEPDTWPDKARDVVRIPQALKTYIPLAKAGRREPFTTYQAMLEQLWQSRIAAADDSEKLIALASDLAGQMAEEEALWVAASRYDDRLRALLRLEALGFVVRSDNRLSVAFSHQSVFEYVLARTFIRTSGLLSNYVLERQDSLFVRAKIWSSLTYLRGAETNSYEREFLAIWTTKSLRRHLRLLLISFLGQVSEPLGFERTCMAEVLQTPELRILGLKAIADSAGWFAVFATTAIRDAMSGNDAEAGHALRILVANWRTDPERVNRLIQEHWLPYPERDSYSWMALHDCPSWTAETEAAAATILRRSPISIHQVDWTAMTLAVEQPEIATRIVRMKLDFLLEAEKAKPAPEPLPPDATEEQRSAWYLRRHLSKEFENLLEAQEWHDLPSLAEAAPSVFIEVLWPWYVSLFGEIVARSDVGDVTYIYPSSYSLDVEFGEGQADAFDRPLFRALQDAIESVAADKPEELLAWADENSGVEILAVQQLIARGYRAGSEQLASKAFDWLLADQRRFHLGTLRGHRRTTIDLLQACSPHWSNVEIARFETAVLSYKPPVPERYTTAGQRKLFADIVRATKKDLLQAVGVDRLSPESRELVVTEQRALGDRFDRSIGEAQGGFIGSPMEAAAMAKAKDRDILKILGEIPDNTNWDHPTHWMRGGNIQLSRAFADFAKMDPARAIRLIEQFEPLQQERAAGYALDAMADDGQNDERVLDALLDLIERGFGADEFRDSAARAVEKIAGHRSAVSDEVISTLVGWLDLAAIASNEGDGGDLMLDSQSDELKAGSILWGYGGASILPGGNFTILSALTSVLLNRAEPGRDQLLEILNAHLERERTPRLWGALLYRLTNAGGSTPQGVSRFIRRLFARVPEILPTREAVIFLAYAQRWDDRLVFDVIRPWPRSGSRFLERAYGELVGLVSTVKKSNDWVAARYQIVDSGTHEAKIGLAYAGVNLWVDNDYRETAGEILVSLLRDADSELAAVVMDVFRVTDELAPDQTTVALLQALADPATDLSAAPSHFVVERLQGVLPNQADFVAAIAEKLVAAWRSELGDMRTGTATAAPQLTDLALTLHRIGGASRETGVGLFEAMIEIDAYGARETLAEIDGRFGVRQGVTRPRLPRRRQSPTRRRRAA